MTIPHRPPATEYAPFYQGYVAGVPEGDILEILGRQEGIMMAVARSVPPGRETFSYAPEKWSIREVFSHLSDGERVFGYRALRISRGDPTPLPGFDENLYVAASGAASRPLRDLAAEFSHLRQSNLFLLHGIDGEGWRRMGTANGHPVSVRALAFIMAGHVRHHLRILHDRYGVELPDAGAT
jgi:hypothetical protein